MKRREENIESIPAELEQAVLSEFVSPPARDQRSAHLGMIAAAADDLAQGGAQPDHARKSTRRARLAAGFAALVIATPLGFAGLAAASVELPEPIDSAFESIGIDLPNQRPDADEAPAADGKSENADGARSQGSKDEKAGQGSSGDRAGGSSGANRGGAGTSGHGPPAHAQDGQTGAPAHSNQGGQGKGTPPAHAQDGVGGPPAHAQDGVSGPPAHSQGAAPPGQSRTAPSPQGQYGSASAPENSGSAPGSGNPKGAPSQAGSKRQRDRSDRETRNLQAANGAFTHE
ncbi:MAG: hypothetical protein ACR2OC_09475 [Solirubrobacterales bacterium]